MSLTALDLFKDHQRLSGDDDALAQHYLDAAEAAVAQRICAPLGSGEGQQPITPDITSAILIWAGHLYEPGMNGATPAALPLVVDALLAPYRRWDAEP